MSKRNLKRYSADNLPASETDWARVDAMTDEEIDFSDIPRLDENFFKDAQLRLPVSKQPVTLRLDSEVLAWFKSQGPGYQTRINAVLRLYMQAVQDKNSSPLS
jgi:uncharacterized protein (DUF4415 family)